MIEKSHWYCFAYIGNDLNSNLACHASTYTGYKNKKVTMDRIMKNKAHAGVTDEAVLLSVSYLGYMSNEEFKGE